MDDNEKIAQDTNTEEKDMPDSHCDSGRIQVADQMPSCVPHEIDSFLHDKAGKLVAAFPVKTILQDFALNLASLALEMKLFLQEAKYLAPM